MVKQTNKVQLKICRAAGDSEGRSRQRHLPSWAVFLVYVVAIISLFARGTRAIPHVPWSSATIGGFQDAFVLDYTQHHAVFSPGLNSKNGTLYQLGLISGEDENFPQLRPLNRPFLGLYGLYRLVQAMEKTLDSEVSSAASSISQEYNTSTTAATNSTTTVTAPRISIPIPKRLIRRATNVPLYVPKSLVDCFLGQYTPAPVVVASGDHDDDSGEGESVSGTHGGTFDKHLLPAVKEWLGEMQVASSISLVRWSEWLNNTLLNRWKKTPDWGEFSDCSASSCPPTFLTSFQENATLLLHEVQASKNPFEGLPIHLVLQLITDHLMLNLIALLRITRLAEGNACPIGLLISRPSLDPVELEDISEALNTEKKRCRVISKNANESAAAKHMQLCSCYNTTKALRKQIKQTHTIGRDLRAWLAKATDDAVVSMVSATLHFDSECKLNSESTPTLRLWDADRFRWYKPTKAQVDLQWIGGASVECEGEDCSDYDDVAQLHCAKILHQLNDRFVSEFKENLKTVYHHLADPYITTLDGFTSITTQWVKWLDQAFNST